MRRDLPTGQEFVPELPCAKGEIVHKIDRRVITGLGLLSGISLVDRTNLENASIAGYVKLRILQGCH
jgi:hypothetical protein